MLDQSSLAKICKWNLIAARWIDHCITETKFENLVKRKEACITHFKYTKNTQEKDETQQKGIKWYIWCWTLLSLFATSTSSYGSSSHTCSLTNEALSSMKSSLSSPFHTTYTLPPASFFSSLPAPSTTCSSNICYYCTPP